MPTASRDEGGSLFRRTLLVLIVGVSVVAALVPAAAMLMDSSVPPWVADEVIRDAYGAVVVGMLFDVVLGLSVAFLARTTAPVVVVLCAMAQAATAGVLRASSPRPVWLLVLGFLLSGLVVLCAVVTAVRIWPSRRVTASRSASDRVDLLILRKSLLIAIVTVTTVSIGVRVWSMFVYSPPTRVELERMREISDLTVCVGMLFVVVLGLAVAALTRQASPIVLTVSALTQALLAYVVMQPWSSAPIGIVAAYFLMFGVVISAAAVTVIMCWPSGSNGRRSEKP